MAGGFGAPNRFDKEQVVRWTPGGVSDDIEDRRGEGGIRLGGIGGGGLGIGATLLLLILSGVFHQNFTSLVTGSGDSTAPRGQVTQSSPRDEREVQFVSFVLDDVQKTWDKEMREQ